MKRTNAPKHMKQAPQHVSAVSQTRKVSAQAAQASRPQHAAHASAVPLSRKRIVFLPVAAVVAAVAIVLAWSPLVHFPSTTNQAATDVQQTYASDTAYAAADEISPRDKQQLGHIIVDGAPISSEALAFIASQKASYTSAIKEMSQNELGLPSGCEIVSLDIALQSYGLDITAKDLADTYLVMDGHFATGYAGSPYGAGGGYPPGIVRCANAYLLATGTKMHAYDLTGTSFEGIEGLLNHGYPVLVWSTMYFEEPAFSGSKENDKEWYNNEHCIVVYGVHDSNVLVSDPIEGLVTRDKQAFARIYETCGSMAAVIVPD